MSIKSTLVGAAVFVFAALPVQADGGGRSAHSVIRLSGYVPVLCRVQLHHTISTPDEDGVADLGVASEFCNAPRGYRVLIRHPADLDGAAVIRDGVRIPLSSSGETILTDSTHPNIQSLSLAMDLGETPERFNSIAMRIEAKA